MYNRTVFPIYCSNPQYKDEMIGAVGRATQSKQVPKWLNSKGFYSASNLYRYGHAFERIKDVGAVVLVEGQGDVVRLWDAGVRNCVGLFKSGLSDEQSILLEKASVNTLVLALDNDEAGIKGAKSIIKDFQNIFQIVVIKYPKNDMGDMTVEEINEIVKPQIKGLF
jgi:DNA primase